MKRRAHIKRGRELRRARPKRSRIAAKCRDLTVYQQARQQRRALAGDRCERKCGRRGDQAHHRWLRSQGGPDTVDNLAWLCTPCHDHIHNIDRAGAERDGWIIPREARR